MRQAITQFQGRNRFLSNFFLSPFVFTKIKDVPTGLIGVQFNCVECAYQACKTTVPQEQLKFVNISPREAKRMGRAVTLRPDWEVIKVPVMQHLVRIKFAVEPLRSQLIATGDAPLIEGNWWHDNFWGACECERCKGKLKMNTLGKILYEERARLMEVSE